jgi:hypothetical protein
LHCRQERTPGSDKISIKILYIHTWHGEGGHDPAVGVDDMGGHSVHDAPDGLPYELRPGNDHGESNEKDGGESAVDSEDRVVNYDLLPLEVVLQARQ